MTAVTVQEFSLEEVAQRNGKDGAPTWIIIKDQVYDVTKYMSEHPGGYDLLEEVAGMDATKAYRDAGHSNDADTIMKKYKIGQIIESERKGNKSKSTENKEDGRSCLSVITCGICC